MKIVFVTPELPLSPRWAGSPMSLRPLPRALKRLGHRVYVIVPRYGGIGIEPVETGVELEVEMDGACRTARLSRARLNGVATYFIESEDYFEGRAIYGESGRDYDDNPFRFAFFSLAALAATEALGLRPDVIHVHDWQTALLPVYQRLEERPSWTPVVLTVHNLAYQGIFPRELLPRLGLPDALFHIDGIEFYGRLNFLKGGLVGAERLTTVSPSYAREMGVPETAMLLESQSTNTGENVQLTRRLLERENLDPDRVILVQKPYMERRTYATFRKVWPEKDAVVTSPQLDFDDYPTREIAKEKVITIMVGDLQRIRDYPARGFQIEQHIPTEVWDAFERLVALGFTDNLILSEK